MYEITKQFLNKNCILIDIENKKIYLRGEYNTEDDFSNFGGYAYSILDFL